MKLKNKKAQQIAKGFLKYLEKVDQIDQLDELSRIQQKQSWSRGMDSVATITSSVALKQAEKTTLKEFLKTNFDVSPKMKYQVDESIIGGLIIRVGNKVIDVSLKHRIEKLKEVLIYA
jgi:F-type H+-transporting ATPase subunit delta